MPVPAFLVLVLLLYGVKLLGLILVAGAGTGCVEGGACVPSVSELLPALGSAPAYCVIAVSFLYDAFAGQSTDASDNAARRVVLCHCAWLALVAVLCGDIRAFFLAPSETSNLFQMPSGVVIFMDKLNWPGRPIFLILLFLFTRRVRAKG